MLNILTPYGDHYKVDKNGNIIRMDIKGFEASDTWKLLGVEHVKRNEFISFNEITPEFLKNFNPCWKNGNPQWTARDLDHGTVRIWGNTKYHGIKKLWFDKEY
ncbi:MAG: hypothetical protein PVG65_01410 [Candidatus Thorarchaeota archaeon]|jgi:hypothetical protein